MLLDYHSFYGGQQPTPHGVVLDWFWDFQRREEEERKRRKKQQRKVVALRLDAELPAVEVYAFGRVRARMLSATALKLDAVAKAIVRAAATSDVSLLPPEMRSIVSVAATATSSADAPVPEATGSAELKVLVSAAGLIPDPDAAALAVARVSLLAQNDVLRPALLAILRVADPIDIDAADGGWTDDMLLLAAAELLLDDEDDEEEE